MPKEKGSAPEEQTDPLDFSCGAGSTGEMINQQSPYDPSAIKSVHPYAFGRTLHPEYSTERSFYYRDSIGKKNTFPDTSRSGGSYK